MRTGRRIGWRLRRDVPARWFIPLDYDTTYWRGDVSLGFRMTAATEADHETVKWAVTVVGGAESGYAESFYGKQPVCSLAHTYGGDYLYLQVPTGDVSLRTNIYRITENGVTRLTNEPLALAVCADTPLDPDRLHMCRDLPDSGGNGQGAYAVYRVSDTGQPELRDAASDGG